MGWVAGDFLYVCSKCMACDCHYMNKLVLPCAGPVIPE